MTIGNRAAYTIIKTFFERLAETKQVTFPFLLLVGPQGIGKTTIIESAIHNLLKEYVWQDYTPLYDCSRVLGKQQTLKIEVPSSEHEISLPDGRVVQNRGVREAIARLTYAPVGTCKVLFLENIERMTTAAANAFLKTFEEPLPQRLLIATATKTDNVLDTILSRAFQVQFHPLQRDELLQYTDATFPWLSSSQKDFLVAFSLWSPGRIHDLMHEKWLLESFADQFAVLREKLTKGDWLVETYQLLQTLATQHDMNQILDALLYMVPLENARLHDRLIRTKQLLTTNVAPDAIRFSLALAE